MPSQMPSVSLHACRYGQVDHPVLALCMQAPCRVAHCTILPYLLPIAAESVMGNSPTAEARPRAQSSSYDSSDSSDAGHVNFFA